MFGIAFLGTDARQATPVVSPAGRGSRGALTFDRTARATCIYGFCTGYIPDGSAKSGGFWTIEYYQPYFDVDTKTVRSL